jgi:NAD-specific glutamate dehydrogenase
MEYGRSVAEMCNAWALAARLLDARRLRKTLHDLDGAVAAGLQLEAYLSVESAVASLTRTLLSSFHGPDLTDLFAQQDAVAAFVAEAGQHLLSALPAVTRTEVRAKARAWAALGLPSALADEIARLGSMGQIVQVFRLSRRTGLPAEDAMAVWMVSAHRSGLGALLAGDEEVAADRWIAAARASLHQDLTDSLLQLALDVAAAVAPARPRTATIERAVDRDPRLAEIWEMARAIAGERDRLPAMVVLTTRLRTRLQLSHGGSGDAPPVIG